MADKATKDATASAPGGEDVVVAASIQPSGTIEELAEYLGVSIEEAIGEALNRIKSSDEANQRIVEIFENNPVAASILTTAAEKGDFFAGLAANLTPEEYSEQIAALTEGSPAFLAKQARLNKKKEQDKRTAGLQEAIDNSNKAFSDWVEAKGLTPEQVDAFEQTIREIANIFEDMRITSAELDKLWMFADMDNILAQSVSDAEISARNDEKSKKREKHVAKTATPIPDIPEGGGSMGEEAVPPEIAELNAIVNRDAKRRNPFG